MEQTYIIDNIDEKQIEEFISQEERRVIHALMVFNIDDFARINNEIGIEESDKILQEIFNTVSSCFRGTDIVVKLKGDEYVVLIKNPGSITNIEKLSEKILKRIADINSQNTVTASIGVAVYPFHGTNYIDLKTKAYQSMVRVKANGKNGCRIYESALTKISYNSFINNNGHYEGIDYQNMDSSAWDKYFKEICLQIFYNDTDPYSAINSVMEIFCLYYGFSRASIITNQQFSSYDMNKLAFSIPGFEVQSSDALDYIRRDLISRLKDSFGEYGLVNSKDTSIDPEILQYLEDMQDNELLYFAINKNDSFVGGIIFENCEDSSVEFDSKALSKLYDQLNIIISYEFILCTMKNPKEIMSKIMMFDGIDALIYIIDSETYAVEYMNNKAIAYVGASSLGKKCHNVINHNDIFCEDCPLRNMDPDNPKANARFESFNFSSKKWSINLLSWLSCLDNKNKILMISVDIDNFFDELQN